MRVSATCLFLLGLFLLVSFMFTASAVAAKPVDYLRDIKPIIAKHCSSCHGFKKQESDLRLDSAASIRLGGSSGASIVPGKPQESLLFLAINGSDEVSKMPPEGTPLSKEQVALIRTWIEQGAKAPKNEKVAIAGADHWAFQSPRRFPLPKVSNTTWPENEIDYFILAKLEKAGLTPSPQANRATLIRRLSLDLLGLPPSPEEVKAFVSDKSPGAYERLVERLLASPAYGERWGRHWLDVARYADSNGYTRDFGREIWRYREWVIAAVSADMPFDQFTIEQFAGDMLPGATQDQRIATGFHRNTLFNEEGGTDKEQFRVDAVADRVNTTGVAYLGLTLGCARCHSHKYDPITQREYYQIFAFLNNCEEPKIEAPTHWQVVDGELKKRQAIRDTIAKQEKEFASQRPKFEAAQKAWEKALPPRARTLLPGPVQVAYDMPFEKRDAKNKKLVEDHFRKQKEARTAFPQIAEIERLRNTQPKIPTTMVMQQRKKPRETFVHKRGNFLDEGARVQAKVPEVLHPLSKKTKTSNRLDFARWLVDPKGPLTSRVVVNRYWMRLFGRGIVETENDFGIQGIPPSHPQLLDWLATEFVRNGWGVKAIHRTIVTSATYRQSSNHRSDLANVDPRNLLLGRQSRVRVDAEIVRDAALTVSGLLSRKIGGPSVHPPQPDGVFDFTQDPKPWKPEPGGDRYRRGMYTQFWRSSPYPALMVFDAPTSNVTCTRRNRSNTPLQALTLANDETFIEVARALARRVLDSSAKDDAARAAYAFQICLARKPSQAENQQLMTLIKQQQAAFAADNESAKALLGIEKSTKETPQLAAWTAISRVLMNLDEFITRE